jgi:hypothetical protein
LAKGVPKNELLEEAEMAAGGSLAKIEFPWSKGGKTRTKSSGSTVLGHIEIENQTMIVEVNSAERALEFEKQVSKLSIRFPGAEFKLKSKVIESIDQEIKRAKGIRELQGPSAGDRAALGRLG